MKNKPDPDCRFCHGDGTYYEDVAGDGGSRMPMLCECWDGDDPVDDGDYIAERVARYDDTPPSPFDE